MREGKEYTAEDVLLGYANPAYDQMAKRLLAQKKVMARIFKCIVPEFAEASLADIADKYIEGELQIGEIPVHADKTNAVRNAPRSPKELRGNNTENASATEGWVHFDILFQGLVGLVRMTRTLERRKHDRCNALHRGIAGESAEGCRPRARGVLGRQGISRGPGQDSPQHGAIRIHQPTRQRHVGHDHNILVPLRSIQVMNRL